MPAWCMEADVTRWIAVDWGTSNLRGWAMDGRRAVAQAQSDRGMGKLTRDRFEPAHTRRIAADNAYYRAISVGWSEALKLAFESLPDYSFYHPKDG